MKKIRTIKNRHNEAVGLVTNAESIVVPRAIHKYGGNTKSEIKLLEDILNRRYSNLTKVTVHFDADGIQYIKNKEYSRGTIIKYNGQIFMAYNVNGDEISKDEPHELSKHWIALTDTYGNKCIAIDDGSYSIEDSLNKYGHVINNLIDIINMRDNNFIPYYNYINDGDYIKVISSSDGNYTMRLNFREWQNINGSVYRSIDLISDELIPTIKFTPYADKFGIEHENIKNVNSFTGLPVWEFSKLSQQIDNYNDRFMQYMINTNYTNGDTGKKQGFYRGYDRLSLKNNTAKGYTSASPDYYINDNNPYTGLPMTMCGHTWLPTEKEVFGQSFSSSTQVGRIAEASFTQYPTLDTAYKRIKTVNGVPKPWATYTMTDDTLYPVIVGVDGTQIPVKLLEKSGRNFNAEVYVPYCMTFISLKM